MKTVGKSNAKSAIGCHWKKKCELVVLKVVNMNYQGKWYSEYFIIMLNPEMFSLANRT